MRMRGYADVRMKEFENDGFDNVLTTVKLKHKWVFAMNYEPLTMN